MLAELKPEKFICVSLKYNKIGNKEVLLSCNTCFQYLKFLSSTGRELILKQKNFQNADWLV